MISPDLRFEQLDPEEWHRLRRVLIPAGASRRTGVPPAASASGGSGGGPLILLLEEGRTASAFRVGREGDALVPHIEDPARYPWEGPHSLGRHRRAAGARMALALDVAAAERLAAELDGKLRVGDDLVAQLLDAARVGRAAIGKSAWLDPDPFASIPIPGFAALQQTLDLLLPDERAAGLFVFDRGRLYTSGIIEKRGGDIVRLTSARALGALPADFRDGKHRFFLEAMARAGLRPHVCGFVTRQALREVLGPQPGALAQAVALRDAVVDPLPPWLLAFVGAGAVAGVAQTAGKLFGRFVPQRIKDGARDAARNFSPFSALGFDPIQLFTDLTRLF